MKHLFLGLAIFFLFSSASIISAQNISVELNGTLISKHSDCDGSHPLTHVFDNNLSTYFHSCPGITSGNWIGLDLGEKHIITKVAYSPRVDSDYRDRLQLGIFEGANQPDFGDAIPLFIISGLSERKLNEQEIVCTRGFRYVRFVFPYAQIEGKSSYMAELKFYGYKGEGDNTRLPQLTNLPTVSIHTVDAEDIVEKEKYLKGMISIVYAGGTKFFSDSLEIRGRGNNSWSYPKKPYRLKLYNSTRLMELPAKAKNWTLINSYGDKTLMRNMLAFDFSRRIEMPYTSPAEAVDVVLNGDYKGCYQLCDHIDVRKNRVDIEEMEPTDLAGGYMVEIDAYADQEPEQIRFTSSTYEIPVTIKYPDDDEITPEQKEYIQSHFNRLMSATKSANYKNVTLGFRKYMDVETFLRHFLVGEYSGNTDTYWSVRMTKKRDEEKFYFGPVWDFDLGFENDNRTYPINDKDEWICFYTGSTVNGQWQSGSSAAGDTRDFIKRIFSDDAIPAKLSEIYSYYRNRGAISGEVLTAVVDSCAELLAVSQDLNFKRWPIMNSYVHANPVLHGSYENEVKNVRNFVAGRIEWMDKKLNYTPGPVSGNNQMLHAANANIWTNKNSIHLKMGEDNTINIVDLSGRVVKTAFLPAGGYFFNETAGVYIVNLTNKAGEKQTYKCVVP